MSREKLSPSFIKEDQSGFMHNHSLSISKDQYDCQNVLNVTHIRHLKPAAGTQLTTRSIAYPRLTCAPSAGVIFTLIHHI